MTALLRSHCAGLKPSRIGNIRPAFSAIAILLLCVTFYGTNPRAAWACACGCGVFSVGTAGMMPTGEGGIGYLEWDTMDQNQNWSGGHASAASKNPDKDIATNFYTAGLQYMFNRTWGLHVQVPYWDRTFKTTDFNGHVISAHYSGVGDIRVEGLYTGFSPDLSTGLTFGLKLPTGSYTFNPNKALYGSANNPVDRDTQIGSGSTDLLLGMYHVGGLSADNAWNWFTQGLLQNPLTGQDGYYPGGELDVAVGTYYDFGTVGFFSKLAPVLTLKASDRAPDSGPASTTVTDAKGVEVQSGYQRVLVAPGIETEVGAVRVYAEVAIPVYQYVYGNQMVASTLYKVLLGYAF